MPERRIPPLPHPVTGCLLTLGIAAVRCGLRWLADPLLEGKMWVLPAAVTTVLAARWFGPGPAAVGLVTTTLAGEFLFVRPRAEWTTMLARDAIPLLVSITVGGLVIWTVWELRTRAVILDREVALRRRAEFDLEVSRTRFEQFLDCAPFCAYLKDTEGRFVFLNRHLRTTYPAVVTGRTVHDVFPAEQADEFTRNDDWVRRTGEPFQCEETAVGPDGVTRHWSTFKFPATADDGRRGLGGISIEITDRKRADEMATRSESLLRRLIEVQEGEKRSLCQRAP